MSEERIGTEVNVDEYMKKGDYAADDSMVKLASVAKMAETANNAFQLGGSSALDFALKTDLSAVQATANNAQASATQAQGTATDAAVKATEAKCVAAAAQTTASEVKVELAGKVDTDDGKGLSTEDYTTAEKSKLAELGVEPVGCIKLFAGNVLPEGYMWCDGEAYPTNGAYTKLFAAIGTIYNKDSDIPGTFRVPDMRGRVGVGKNAWTFKILGSDGGKESVALQETDLPDNGAMLINGNSVTSASAVAIDAKVVVKDVATLRGAHWAVNRTTAQSSGVLGSTTKVSVLQPYLVCNYIIKY